MAYATATPPRLISQALGDQIPAFWVYANTDATTAVRVTGYFTNAKDLGMKKGDIVWYIKTDASPISAQIYIVSAINANGSADLSDGTAITATNTD